MSTTERNELRELTAEEMDAVAGGASNYFSGDDEAGAFKALALEIARNCGMLGSTSTF
jgi:hypothetical protein